MDFSISDELLKSASRFDGFLQDHVKPNLSAWVRDGTVPREFFRRLGENGWFENKKKGDLLKKQSSLKAALLMENIAVLSPGVSITFLVQVDLGMTGLWLLGTDRLQKKYGESAILGNTLICLGNTERQAGSDAAGISMSAEPVDGGWILNGAKAYVTNGWISDMAVMTAITDPDAPRNQRASMFLVDLHAQGVTRKKLNKQVWIPSDLTRLQLKNVFVPKDHFMGERGRGLSQVLTIFTHSRVPISALTLGTAWGAFKLALDHAKRRDIFGAKIVDQQAKSFEAADLYAGIEAARLSIWRACWAMDNGKNFKLASSIAKYLSVDIARKVTQWAADIFGAASVMADHPVHKFPMDAWAASLGEGTQDVQKLVIFREMMKHLNI